MISPKISEEIFNRLFTIPDNKACIDCLTVPVEFASINHGIFICKPCSELHKKYSNNISIIKSIYLHLWTENELNLMIIGGNLKFKNFLENYHYPKDYTNEQKYFSKAVSYYREMLFFQLTNSLIKEAPIDEEGIQIEYENNNIYNENDINPKKDDNEEMIDKTWGFFSKIADYTKTTMIKVNKTVKDPNFQDEIRFYGNKFSDKSKEIGLKAFNFFKKGFESMNNNGNNNEINKKFNDDETIEEKKKNFVFPEDKLDKTLVYLDQGYEKIKQINYGEKIKNFGKAVVDISKNTYHKVQEKIEDKEFQDNLKSFKNNLSYKTRVIGEKTTEFAEKAINNIKIKIDGDPQKKVKEKLGEDSLEYQEIKEFDGNNNLKEYMMQNALEQKK